MGVLLAFGGKSPRRAEFREQSRRAADEFGEAFDLGESKQVVIDTFGYEVSDDQLRYLMKHLFRYGGRVVSEKELQVNERALGLGSTGGLDSRPYTKKPKKRVRPKKRQRNHGIEGGSSSRSNAFESHGDPRMKIQEGRFFAAKSAFDATRIHLDEDGVTVKGKPSRTQLPRGTYFVLGKGKEYATIGEGRKAGTTVYNVALSVLEGVIDAKLTKTDLEERQARRADRLREVLKAKFEAHVDSMRLSELTTLAKRSRIVVEADEDDEDFGDEMLGSAVGDDTDMDVDDSPGGESPDTEGDDTDLGFGDDLDDTGFEMDNDLDGDFGDGDMGLDGNPEAAPMSQSDYDSKRNDGKAAYMGGEPYVVLKDVDTGLTVLTAVDIRPDDDEEVQTSSTSKSTSEPSDSDDDSDDE